jgi:hypothetical protein
VFAASLTLYGVAGVLPSVLTDGGSLLLVVVLIVSFAWFHAP